MTTLKQIERVYSVLFSNIFTTKGKLSYERVGDAISLLCDLLSDYKADDCEQWYIDPYYVCSLGDMIAGLYWHYTDWHAGQSSKSYRVFCKLGQIYNPNCTGYPEEGTSENDCYILMESLATKVNYVQKN